MANVYKNKLVEIYGLPDYGKTKFVLKLLKSIQNDNKDDICLYADLDNKLHKEWIKLNNLDKERIIFVFNIKDLLNMLQICGNIINTVIIDSIPMSREYNLELLLSELKNHVDVSGSVYIINQVRCSLKDGEIPYYGNITQKYIDARIHVLSNNNITITKQRKASKAKNYPVRHSKSSNTILNLLDFSRESVLSVY